MSATIASSLEIGNSILGRLQGVAGVPSKRVEQAGFAVLKSSDIPYVLVDTVFISNNSDCRKLVDPPHQQMLAEAISSGVHNDFRDKPPQDILLAALKAGQGV